MRGCACKGLVLGCLDDKLCHRVLQLLISAVFCQCCALLCPVCSAPPTATSWERWLTRLTLADAPTWPPARSRYAAEGVCSERFEGQHAPTWRGCAQPDQADRGANLRRAQSAAHRLRSDMLACLCSAPPLRSQLRTMRIPGGHRVPAHGLAGGCRGRVCVSHQVRASSQAGAGAGAGTALIR